MAVWRSTKISASSEARDRKRPTNAHQISLQNRTISRKIHPIRSLANSITFPIGTGEQKSPNAMLCINE
jgi:hypothetical protein